MKQPGVVRTIWISLSALAALGVSAAMVSVASAGTGATATPFKWSDASAGLSCSGVHILKTGANPLQKESETCIDTVGYFAPGTYSIGPEGDTGWFSDYHYYILHEPLPVVPTDPNVATSGTLVVTGNGDGTYTWNVVSYYP